MGRLTTIFLASPFLVACWRLAEAATDQEAAGILRRSTHDAAAQALVPGGGLGRSRFLRAGVQTNIWAFFTFLSLQYRQLRTGTDKCG